MMRIRLTLFNIFLIITIVISAILQVIILNHYSTAGEKLVSALKEIEAVEKENNRLDKKIASSSALATISSKAKQYGLTSNQQIVSLTAPLPLAFFQKSSL